MEKTFATSEQEVPVSHSLPNTTTIQRKPLPPTTTTAVPATTASSLPTKTEAPAIQPPPHDHTAFESTSFSAPLPALPPRPLHKRLYTRYTSLPRRKRYILLGTFTLLIALIIGLAAGLSTRNTHFKNLPLPTSHGGPYEGDLTYYAPGLGACGVTSTSSDYIVAVSHLLFDAVQRGSDPNANPLCGLMVRARRGEKSVDLKVVDRCVGCKDVDLDVSETVFAGLADVSAGRVRVEWAWLQDAPDVGS